MQNLLRSCSVFNKLHARVHFPVSRAWTTKIRAATCQHMICRFHREPSIPLCNHLPNLLVQLKQNLFLTVKRLLSGALKGTRHDPDPKYQSYSFYGRRFSIPNRVHISFSYPFSLRDGQDPRQYLPPLYQRGKQDASIHPHRLRQRWRCDRSNIRWPRCLHASRRICHTA